MPVIDPDNYSFSFGQLADVIPPARSFAGLDTAVLDDAASTFCKLAARHGLLAALNRLVPEGKYAGDISPNKRSFVINRKAGPLTITRHHDMPDGQTHFRIHGPRDGNNIALLFSSQTRMIVGGDWLQKLQDTANKAPFSRFESGAVSFQHWLKMQP